MKQKRAPDTLEAIAERLIALRTLNAPTQTAFCNQVNIQPNTWNQYETAKQRISLDMAIRLSKATGVTLDWIYLGDTTGMPIRYMPIIASDRRVLESQTR